MSSFGLHSSLAPPTCRTGQGPARARPQSTRASCFARRSTSSPSAASTPRSAPGRGGGRGRPAGYADLLLRLDRRAPRAGAAALRRRTSRPHRGGGRGPRAACAGSADEIIRAFAAELAADATRRLAQFELYVESSRRPALRAVVERCLDAYRGLAEELLRRGRLPRRRRRRPAVVALLDGLGVQDVAVGDPQREERIAEGLRRIAVAFLMDDAERAPWEARLAAPVPRPGPRLVIERLPRHGSRCSSGRRGPRPRAARRARPRRARPPGRRPDLRADGPGPGRAAHVRLRLPRRRAVARARPARSTTRSRSACWRG